jgi:catechol 2,3-dioxygenase-like lactoylglutathione lyase family enzyme
VHKKANSHSSNKGGITVTRIDHVPIGTPDIEAAIPVYSAICGTEPSRHTSPDGTAMLARFYLGDAMVELVQPIDQPEEGIGAAVARRLRRAGAGVHLVCLPSDDPAATAEVLAGHGAEVFRVGNHRYVHPRSANGVLVQLTPRRDFGTPPPSGDAHFDHVAIVVADLDQACDCWEKILGGAPDTKGRHPLGTFDAARFLLADRMIELVAPCKGIESAVSKRLASAGEGVNVLTLVARDLDRTIGRVKAAGARVVRQEPHWFVHPKDASGVLVQLTPRLEH